MRFAYESLAEYREQSNSRFNAILNANVMNEPDIQGRCCAVNRYTQRLVPERMRNQNVGEDKKESFVFEILPFVGLPKKKLPKIINRKKHRKSPKMRWNEWNTEKRGSGDKKESKTTKTKEKERRKVNEIKRPTTCHSGNPRKKCVSNVDGLDRTHISRRGESQPHTRCRPSSVSLALIP